MDIRAATNPDLTGRPECLLGVTKVKISRLLELLVNKMADKPVGRITPLADP